jgi:beta-barrel assembly-enhancing protease
VKAPIRFTPAALVLVVLAGCSSLSLGSLSLSDVQAIGQGVQQVQTAEQTEFTPEQEYYIGRAVAANLLTTRKVYDNPRATDYLNTLERALSIYSDRPETFKGYHLLVIDSDEINAFAAPGGLILVSRGLLRCATSEDTVAAILAHETSHVVLKHGLNAIKQARQTAAWRNLAMTGVAVAGSSELNQLTDIFKDSITDITNTLVNSGYSRELEFQADQMALQIMRNAGYDPRAFDDMLKVMKSRITPGGLDFAKTHPDPKDRIVEVEKTLASTPVVSAAPQAQAARQARYQAALGNI